MDVLTNRVRHSELELLQAAADRRLVGLVDVVDRQHVVWSDLGSCPEEACAADTRLVASLFAGGQLQLGDARECVPWYGDHCTARGARILPTTSGLARLERLRDRAELAELAAGAQLVSAGGAR